MNNFFHSTKRWTRRQTGLPPVATCLVTLSVALLALGATTYVMALPTLLPQPETQGAAQEGGAEIEASPNAQEGSPEAGAEQAAGDGANGSEAEGQGQDQPGQGDDGEKNKDDGDGERDGLSLPGLSLDSADVQGGAEGSTDDPDGEATPEGDDSDSDDGAEPGHGESTVPRPDPDTKPQPGQGGGNGSGSGSGSDSGSGSGSDPDDVITSEPTEEQESRLYDHLVKYANRLPGYVSEVNACVTTFEQTCLSTDYNARVQGRSSCMSLFNTLLSEFVAVRDYPRSNYSRYAKAHDDLINMYRCLFSYVDNYVDAWDANLAYEDPSGHVDDFMAPLYANMVNGKNQYLAEFEVSYQGFTL